MQRSIIISLLGLALILTGLVQSNEVDAAGSPRGPVAYIDLSKTMSDTKAGKAAKRSFEAKKAKRENEIQAKKKAFQRKQANLDKQKLLLGQDKLNARIEELKKEYSNLTIAAAKAERELAVEQMKLMQTIFAKARPQIEAVAKAEGFTVVLDGSAVLWSSGGTDITAKVNRRIR